MLGSLGQFVVKVANLAEAEGRVARTQAIRLGAALLIGVAAALLFVIGVAVVCAGAYMALAEVMHPGGALVIIGLLLVIGAGGGGVLARRVVKPEGAAP